MLPLLDVKDDPAGKRYAVIEGGSERESGVWERRSGIISLDKAPIPDIARQKPTRQPPPNPQGIIGDELARAIENAGDDDVLTVWISLARGGPDAAFKLARRIAEGEVNTQADLSVARASVIGERKSTIREIQEPVVQLLTSIGGVIVKRFENLHALTAQLPAGAVSKLHHPSIQRIDVHELNVPQSPDWNQVRAGAQVQQMLDDGYNGGLGFSPDLAFGHISSYAPDDDHLTTRLISRTPAMSPQCHR